MSWLGHHDARSAPHRGPLATGTFDADARADVAIANYDSNSVTVLTSLTPGPPPPAGNPSTPAKPKKKCKKRKGKKKAAAAKKKRCKKKKKK